MEDLPLYPTQPPTPEQIREAHELSLRLAGIFMPQALRQMKALYERVPGQTTGRLVHYTTAEAALQIIEKKRRAYLLLHESWTNYAYPARPNPFDPRKSYCLA